MFGCHESEREMKDGKYMKFNNEIKRHFGSPKITFKSR